MAPTWAEARRMSEVCEQNGVQLTFNHQRRFGPEFRQARELIRSGAMGELQRLEGYCGNLFDRGNHWFDMLFFYNEERTVDWIIGQVEPTGGPSVFGVQLEGQAVSQFHFNNDVIGTLFTSAAKGWPLSTRIIGSDGLIEVALRTAPLRTWLKAETGWQEIELTESNSLQDTVARGVVDLVQSLHDGVEPELSSRKVLKATELIFATYESTRNGGRVELPLQVADSTILATA